MDHADFKAGFDARIYHGDSAFDGRAGTRRVVVEGYTPDPRCPELVVWASVEGGARVPGFKKGWDRERVLAHLEGPGPVVTTCSDCAAGIANDDWSHLDYSPGGEAADALRGEIAAWLEGTGQLCLAGSTDDETFECECCGRRVFDGTAVTHEVAT